MMRKPTVVCILLSMVIAISVYLPVQAEKTKLSVAMWVSSAEYYNQMLDIVKVYEEAHPNIDIDLMYELWATYHDKMLTMIASGLAPDVMVLSRVYLPQFVEIGAVQPMEGFFAKETRFNPKTDVAELVSGTYKGKVYGIPIWGGPAIMLYNGDMFKQAGLVTPDKQAQNGAWNWDNYVALGKKLTLDTNGDKVIDRFMAAEMTNWIPAWQARIFQTGGRVVSDDGTKAAINQPAAVQALDYWLSLAYQHHIAPRAGEAAKGFEAQGTAMVHSWSTSAPTVYGQKLLGAFEMGLALQPAGPKGYFHTAGGCPIAISSTTKMADAAYDFATWFALFSDQWKIVGLPASMRILRREYMTFLNQYFTNSQVITQAYENPTRPEEGIGPYYSKLAPLWNPILAKAMNGEISAGEAAESMAQVINAVLSGK